MKALPIKTICLSWIFYAVPACKHTNESSENLEASKSVRGRQSETSYSCDDAKDSFASKQITSFLNCTTTDVKDSDHQWSMQLTNSTVKHREWTYDTVLQMCFRKPPEEHLSIMQKMGLGETPSRSAHLAHYSVRLDDSKRSLRIVDGALFYLSPKGDGQIAHFFPGVYYQLDLGPEKNGSREGFVRYGAKQKFSRPVYCVRPVSDR